MLETSCLNVFELWKLQCSSFLTLFSSRQCAHNLNNLGIANTQLKCIPFIQIRGVTCSIWLCLPTCQLKRDQKLSCFLSCCLCYADYESMLLLKSGHFFTQRVIFHCKITVSFICCMKQQNEVVRVMLVCAECRKAHRICWFWYILTAVLLHGWAGHPPV